MIDAKDVVAKIKKKHGRKAARLFSDLTSLSIIPGGISTQCLALDFALGRPGLPRGRLTEIAGKEASSKSTLGAHILAETQRRKGLAILVETESGLDLDRCRAMGVDVENLVLLEPPNMEAAFEYMEEAIELVTPDTICSMVWDSVAGTQSAAEAEADYDESRMAEHARILARGLRKLMPIVAEKKVALVFINQLKANIGGYGPPDVSFGGRAIPFHSSVRIHLKKKKTEMDVDIPIGIWVQAFFLKNKVARPFMTADYLVNFVDGIDQYQDLLEVAMEMKLFKKSGGWYKYKKKSFLRRKMPQFVKAEFGSLSKFKAILKKRAKKQKLVKPYGQV